MLSIWRPSEEVMDLLSEGSRLRIYHLTAAGVRLQIVLLFVCLFAFSLGFLQYYIEVTLFFITVEPRYNEPPFNEVLDITNENLRPGQNYSKMYGIEPRYNEPRFSEFLDITNRIRKPKRKIHLDIKNYSVDT